MPNGNEARYESSSTNIVAISGLHAALSCLDIDNHREQERVMTDYLVERLSHVEKVRMYLPCNRENHIGIVSFIHEEMNSEDIGMILDEDFDIAVRTGYHCAPYIHEYLKDKQSMGTVRIGLSRFTSKEDIDTLIDALIEINE